VSHNVSEKFIKNMIAEFHVYNYTSCFFRQN
jgi:hypothetical protein